MKTLSVGLRSILVSSIQSFIIGLQVVLCSVKLGLVGNEEDLMLCLCDVLLYLCMCKCMLMCDTCTHVFLYVYTHYMHTCIYISMTLPLARSLARSLSVSRTFAHAPSLSHCLPLSPTPPTFSAQSSSPQRRLQRPTKASLGQQASFSFSRGF